LLTSLLGPLLREVYAVKVLHFAAGAADDDP
jgi:hypothetical protein